MPFPLFHALAYKMHTKSDNLVYSILPDYFGLINISLWDKMHNKKRIRKYLNKYGNNEAIRAIVHHLEMDDFLDSHVHTDDGILSDIRKEVDNKLITNFNISGNFVKDVSEFVIEISLDQVVYEKYKMNGLYNKSIKNMEFDEIAFALKRYLKKSEDKIVDILEQLKCVKIEDIISVDGMIRLARKRYGFNLRTFIEIAKRVKSNNLRHALKNAMTIRKFAVDKVYKEKLKEIVNESKEKIKNKMGILIKELKNANPQWNRDSRSSIKV